MTVGKIFNKCAVLISKCKLTEFLNVSWYDILAYTNSTYQIWPSISSHHDQISQDLC
jgi:hypothetical protein